MKCLLIKMKNISQGRSCLARDRADCTAGQRLLTYANPMKVWLKPGKIFRMIQLLYSIRGQVSRNILPRSGWKRKITIITVINLDRNIRMITRSQKVSSRLFLENSIEDSFVSLLVVLKYHLKHKKQYSTACTISTV